MHTAAESDFAFGREATRAHPLSCPLGVTKRYSVYYDTWANLGPCPPSSSSIPSTPNTSPADFLARLQSIAEDAEKSMEDQKTQTGEPKPYPFSRKPRMDTN